ncbi:MAG TPA: hypothetical protein P5123_13030 [Spirochaetota bacterium]|nr:hypothetical protein [Spirochaetota bacterium]
MNYKIKVTDEGNNQVEVLKKITENHYRIEWTFTLKKDSNPIVLSEMYNDDCFVIVNWNAWVRAYSISKKELIYEKKFNGNISSSAALSKDNTELFTAYRCKDGNFLDVISLTDFSTEKSILLPDDLNPGFLACGPGETVLFYKSDVDFGEKASHGYYTVNLISEKISYTEMEYPQLDEFETAAPVISLKHNIGAMPLWDVEIKMDSNNEPLFIMKIMLFDLNSFKIIKSIPVREFRVEELSCRESASEETAEALLKKAGSSSNGLLSKFFQKTSSDEDNIDLDEYYESMVEFISGNLYSIFFYDEKSFWVSFRGGIVRRVGFDGSLSPLFKTVSLPDFSNEQMQTPDEILKTFHSHIGSVDNKRVILQAHNELYQMDINESELTSKEAVIEKALSEKKKEHVEISENDKKKIEDKDATIINVKNIKSNTGLLEALDQIVELTADIDEIKSGHLLIFKVSDGEKELPEEEFFKKAVSIKGAANKIIKIIDNFTTYKEASRLYYNEETTALAYAVYYLTKSDPQYIDYAIKYLSVIDAEHDFFNGNMLLPMLFEKYSESHGSYLKEELSKLEDGQLWLEGYEDE